MAAAVEEIKEILMEVPAIIKSVILNPDAFFRSLPKEGGYLQPIVFMVAIGVICGLIGSVVKYHGLGGIVGSLILTPAINAISGIILAVILLATWKLMGAEATYEVACRCAAYASGIGPATTILGLLPYVGVLLGLTWMTYLLVIASVKVVGIKPKKAWCVFGAIAITIAIFSLAAEHKNRRIMHQIDRWEEQIESYNSNENMLPKGVGNLH